MDVDGVCLRRGRQHGLRGPDTPDLSGVTDMSHMFSGASAFGGDISSWNASQVTDLSHIFRDARSFNADISSWDVSSAADMEGMFDGATSFSQNLGGWYIVLDGGALSGAADSIGIAAQNQVLDRQDPRYTIDGAAPNGDKFRIANGSHLAVRADQTVAQGQYDVAIKSTGSFGVGNSKIVEITVSEDIVPQTNNPPTVDAGANLTASEGRTVTLSGTATDPDRDDILAYSWSQDSPAAPTIAFINSTLPSAIFTAPEVDADTAFTFTLNVTDGIVHVHDAVTVTVRDIPDVANVTSITPDGLYLPGKTVDVRINFARARKPGGVHDT